MPQTVKIEFVDPSQQKVYKEKKTETRLKWFSPNARKLCLVFAVMVLTLTAVLFIGALGITQSYGVGDFKFHLSWDTDGFESFVNKVFNFHWQLNGSAAGNFSSFFIFLLYIFTVGFGLSASGAAYQAVFNNPMATPDLLGVSSGAILGNIIASYFLGFGYYGRVTVGLLFGFGAILFVMFLSRLINGFHSSTITLLLVGIVTAQLFNSIVTCTASGFFQNSDDSSSLYELISDLQNGMLILDKDEMILVAAVCAPCLILLILLGWRLNTLAFGDEEARGMGANPNALRRTALLGATVITAIISATCGQISFVGLVAPHMARRIFGSNYILVIPASMLLGTIFIMLGILMNQVFMTQINVFTSIIGVPYFIHMLLRERRIKNCEAL